MGNQKSKISDDGFELKNTSGRTRLWLSKLGEIPLTFHRDLPDNADIKTVTVKQEPTGKWYAILGVSTPRMAYHLPVGSCLTVTVLMSALSGRSR